MMQHAAAARTCGCACCHLFLDAWRAAVLWCKHELELVMNCKLEGNVRDQARDIGAVAPIQSLQQVGCTDESGWSHKCHCCPTWWAMLPLLWPHCRMIVHRSACVHVTVLHSACVCVVYMGGVKGAASKVEYSCTSTGLV